MKKNVLFMFLMTLLFVCNGLSAKEKKVRFGMGLNYPIGLEKDGFEESHIGVYLAGMYNFSNSPFSLDINMSYESYTIFPNGSIYPYNGVSLAVIPSVIYNLKKGKNVQPYVGLGTGVSVDNIETGVFNSGYAYHFSVVPKIGIRVFNHIDITAKYYITHKDFPRLMVGCGYTF